VDEARRISGVGSIMARYAGAIAGMRQKNHLIGRVPEFVGASSERKREGSTQSLYLRREQLTGIMSVSDRKWSSSFPLPLRASDTGTTRCSFIPLSLSTVTNARESDREREREGERGREREGAGETRREIRVSREREREREGREAREHLVPMRRACN